MNLDGWGPFLQILQRYGPWGAAALLFSLVANALFSATSNVVTTDIPSREKLDYLVFAGGVMILAAFVASLIIAAPICYSRVKREPFEKGENDGNSDVEGD